MMEPTSVAVRNYQHMNQRLLETADAINWSVTASLLRLTDDFSFAIGCLAPSWKK
jgi:hypothetical protein